MADSLLNEDNQDSNERDSLLTKWKDKSKEEILEAKINSDLFIKTKNAQFDDLKKDYLELRERQQASADLKDLLDQIKKDRLNPDASNHLETNNQTGSSLKPEDIESLVTKQVSEKLSEHQRILLQRDNFNSVQTKLKEAFGNDYQASYKQRLDNLGITSEYADELAKNHPSVFIKTFDLEAQRSPSSQAPPRTQQRQTSFAPNTPVRDWAYYQELKKANPKIYLDPKISIQMHNDAIELGDRFGMPQD